MAGPLIVARVRPYLPLPQATTNEREAMTEAKCPVCNSDDPLTLLGECADRAMRYGEGKRVRLRLADPFHQPEVASLPPAPPAPPSEGETEGTTP